MRKLGLVALMVAALASPAVAGQVQVGFAGSNYGPYQTGVGGEFTINPPGPQTRTFTSQTPLEWQWTVTPLASGDKELIIDVAGEILIDKNKTQITLKVLREPIEIRVDKFRWVKAIMSEVAGLIALCAATLSGLVALVSPLRRRFLYAVRRGRHSNSDQE